MSAINRACEQLSRSCYDCFHAPLTRRNLLIWGGVLLGIVILIIIIAVAASGSHGKATPPGSYVIKNYPLIDGCNNLAANMKLLFNDKINQSKFNINQNMSEYYNGIKCQTCQTDFFRLKAGFVGTQVFVAEVHCDSQAKDAVAQTLDQIDVIRRLIDISPMKLVTSSSTLKDTFGSNRGAMIAVRGGHSIDSRLSVLRSYYNLGIRTISLVSYSNTTNTTKDIITNTTCYPPWINETGLTDFGKKVIDEIKRLGMIIDLTGLNKTQIENIVEYANCPVIFSHSNAANLTKHGNNLENDTLTYLQKKNVLVMLTFTPEQIETPSKKHSIEAFIEHLTFMKNYLTVSKVGLGSNFDSSPNVIQELYDVSRFPKLFDTLQSKYGWSQDDLKKLAGQNFINIFSDIEAIAKRSNEHPIEDRESDDNFKNIDKQCYTDRHIITPTTTVPTISSTTSSPNASSTTIVKSK